MLTKIGFKNYKLFKHSNKLEIKPITILFGKNSSGKSSITKFLYVFLEHLNSKSNDFGSNILTLNHQSVEIGAEFRDLIYGRTAVGVFEIEISQSTKVSNFIFNNHSTTFFSPLLEKGSSSIEEFSKNLNQDLFYLGPFRTEPERSISIESTQYDPQGRHMYQFLLKAINNSESDLLQNIGDWYEKNFEGWRLLVNTERAPIFTIELKKNNVSVNLKDTGNGLSQVLPIIISCFLKAVKENLLLVFEQPELHLHPAAHGEIAELFVKTAMADHKKRFVIETHSQNIILRIRKLIAEGVISPNDVSLNFIDFDEENTISTIRKINVDEFGKVDFWPEGIFEEAFHEAVALRRAQKEREKNNEIHN
jgi:predicted ATPase